NAIGVVDVISSEDIGKFPDTNLAESLQRITGVAISRSNGEGSQLTVRGWGPQFNLVTLNGRQMPGTGNSRNYSFENLSSDGVSALEIHKTTRADNPSGGLGATVNIVTTKPLDLPGLRYSASLKAINDTSNVTGDDATPELSAVYSNTFNDETFGVAFSFNHHRRDFQRQSASIQGWQANVALPSNIDPVNAIDNRPTDANGDPIANYTSEDGPVAAYFFPRDMNYSIADFKRERTNANVTFQYAPVDELIVTLDFTGTKSITGENSLGWGMWNDYGGNINAYELDANGTAIYADISGNDGSFTASRGTTEVNERSVGINFAWQAADDLIFSFDYHDSKNETDNGADKGLGSYGSLVLGSDQLITKIYDFRSGDIPHSQIFWNNGTTTLGAGEIDSHFSQFIHSPGESTVKQLQIDGTWENFDTFDVPLVQLNFGVSTTKQTAGGSHAWSGLIGGFLFNPSYTAIFPDSMFTLHDTSGFLDEFDGGGSALTPNYYYSFDFDEVVARSAAFLTNEVLGGEDYFDTTAYHPLGTTSSSLVEEKTKSIYLNSLWEFDLANYPVQINAGFRYEESEVPASALVNIPSEVWWQGGSEWHTQYSGVEQVDLTGEYDLFLPAFDFKIELTEELVGRVSLGKSIARPDLGALLPSKSYSGSPKIGSRNGTEGNTSLLPYESLNLDLSLEWYYAEGSY
ncbi:MAG: TonB-dependent receptor, partial [Kangiellaceae bacterium]|nr:TonB-dependent receptor [Kangiellaceae bacterium]